MIDINDPTECDCGRPKFAGNESCSHCAFLDGTGWNEARIIAALRVYSWLTLKEIGAMLDRNADAMQRPVHDLYKSGRLRRQWRESEGTEGAIKGRYGGMIPAVHGAVGSWEYALVSTRRPA